MARASPVCPEFVEVLDGIDGRASWPKAEASSPRRSRLSTDTVTAAEGSITAQSSREALEIRSIPFWSVQEVSITARSSREEGAVAQTSPHFRA